MNAKTRVRCYKFFSVFYYVLPNGTVFRVSDDDSFKTWADMAEWAEIVPYVGF